MAFLWLVCAIAAVILTAAVFDATVRAVVANAAASKAVAYTAGHFVSPALPGWVCLASVLLLPFFAVLARLAGDAPMEDGPSLKNVTANGRQLGARKIMGGVAVLLMITVAMKAATMEPMLAGEGRVAGMVRFVGGVNRAFAAKARFDEKAYVQFMADALLADGPAFGRFARSWYWAFFADEGVTRDSKRATAAIAVLEPLYREGQLTDQAAFELAKLFSENGMAQKARDVIKSLLTRNPRNVGYAEFEAALAAENEK